MQAKLIIALADVLGVDLQELATLSEQQQLEHLENMQMLEVLSI